MTHLTKQAFEALTIGIVLSVVISAFTQEYPEFAAIGIVLFVVGIIQALYEFHNWYNSAEIEDVFHFVLGTVNAVFGLAIAFATTDPLIKMLIAAVVFDAFFAVLAKLGIGE